LPDFNDNDPAFYYHQNLLTRSGGFFNARKKPNANENHSHLGAPILPYPAIPRQGFFLFYFFIYT